MKRYSCCSIYITKLPAEHVLNTGDIYTREIGELYGRHRYRWKVNIKIVLEGTGYEDMDSGPYLH
jgi:hypothetical protein